MTTQTKPRVEIAIDELVYKINYTEEMKLAWEQAISSMHDLGQAVYDPYYMSREERFAAIAAGISKMRFNLETQINDLNTFEAEFSEVLEEIK